MIQQQAERVIHLGDASKIAPPDAAAAGLEGLRLNQPLDVLQPFRLGLEVGGPGSGAVVDGCRERQIAGIHLPESPVGRVALMRLGERHFEAKRPLAAFVDKTDGFGHAPSFDRVLEGQVGRAPFLLLDAGKLPQRDAVFLIKKPLALKVRQVPAADPRRAVVVVALAQ